MVIQLQKENDSQRSLPNTQQEQIFSLEQQVRLYEQQMKSREKVLAHVKSVLQNNIESLNHPELIRLLWEVNEEDDFLLY